MASEQGHAAEIDAHYQELISYARQQAKYLTSIEPLQEDAAAEAVARLFGLVETVKNEKAWLCSTMRNYIQSQHRLKFERDRVEQAKIPLPSNLEGPDAELDAIITGFFQAPRTSQQVFYRQMFEQLRKQLTDKQWLLLRASLDGLSHEEIAELLGYASAASVSQSLLRIRQKLEPVRADWMMD